MVTDQQTVEPSPELRTEGRGLQPFYGFLSPGICFASGHCIWLLRMADTPTSIGTYDEVWLITPEGERVLYVDPAEAGWLVENYHEFDRVEGADITWEKATREEVLLGLEGADGTSLNLQAALGGSPATRLLTLIAALTPNPILRTSAGERISNLLFDLMMDANGLKVAGRTERHERYRNEADALRIVTSASATLNGEDLGEFRPPHRDIAFGDAVVPNEAFFSFGALYLHPPSGS